VREALSGDPTPGNEKYVKWLVEESMLWDAKQLAIQLSGQGSMFQNPFAHPDPRAALERASVWFTAYPLSFMTRPGQSFLGGLADRDLWQAFMRIGIDAVHTGPVKQAGGLDGWRQTPSVDGHFDRISMQVDPAFGDEEAFRTLCLTASEFDGVVIDDIVPGHTGKGADFRLAEMGYADYPGIYHMVSIAPHDWHLLPEVPDGQDSANLDARDSMRPPVCCGGPSRTTRTPSCRPRTHSSRATGRTSTDADDVLRPARSVRGGQPIRDGEHDGPVGVRADARAGHAARARDELPPGAATRVAARGLSDRAPSRRRARPRRSRRSASRSRRDAA
jgi:hypothetical protein